MATRVASRIGSPASLASLLSLLLAGHLCAQLPTYTFEPIVIPGATAVAVTGINAVGTVVGYYGDSSARYHGFLLSAGTVITVDHPGSTHTWFEGINDSGVVAGAFSSGNATPFTWQGGAFQVFSLPPNSGVPAAIDDAGVVVGSYADMNWREHGFRSAGGNLTVIDYPGVLHTHLHGRNNLGTEVGAYWAGDWRGFVLQGTTFTPLDMPGAAATVLEDINDGGWIVGQQIDASGSLRSAVVYDGATFWPLSVPGNTGWSDATAISSTGVVAGTYQGTHNGVYGQYGFVARPVTCQADLGFGTVDGGRLSVCGSPMAAGAAAELALTNLPANTPACIALGFSYAPTPLFGGTVVPVPAAAIAGVASDAFGEFRLPGIAGGGGSYALFVQAAYLDTTLPFSVGLSNAVRIDYLP